MKHVRCAWVLAVEIPLAGIMCGCGGGDDAASLTAPGVVAEGGVDGAPDAVADASSDAGCPAGVTLCGAACVSLQSPSNCGECGHVCLASEVCNAGTCAGSCGAELSNCSGACVSLPTDLLNCGGCGNACNLPNATAVCANSQCMVSICNAGFADCNGNGTDGCEVGTQTHPSNCGACGHACLDGEVCNAGVCSTSCDAGLSDCGGACVSLANDPSNCGGCGATCSLPNATAGCASSQCTVAACTAGFTDCDTIVGNGCEVNTDTDVDNCSTCGLQCAANQVCSSGICTEGGGCPPGQTQCGSSCVDLNTNVYNCGACGRVCASTGVASSNCAGSTCNSSCQLGFANCSLPPAPAADDGCERSVSENDQSCGSCGNDCTQQGQGGGLVCDGGNRPKNQCGCSSNDACRTSGSGGTCNTGTGLCSCGYGPSCRPGETCVSQYMFDSCSCNGGSGCGFGQVCCQSPAGCRNLSTDANNCGACGHDCPAGFGCESETCVCSGNPSCNAGSDGSCTGGHCVCGGVTCEVGQRCLTNGVCG